MDNEDACFEFRQERDLMYRTHLYYLDYEFSQVSTGILISGQVTLSARKSLPVMCFQPVSDVIKGQGHSIKLTFFLRL